ncbi:MAG: SDR family oxidoreductase [Synechococcaceae cyanobacterium SM1_2_3]|nr:SDR family oxidoreductase [Synechococcaceae cyanobacterium SM1_2_3]
MLITGVVGGIGAATARLFSEQGWRVIGVDQQPIPHELELALFIQADLSQPEAAARIISEVTTSAVQLDALVNNAALQICKPLLAMTVQEWDLIMAVNLRSVFMLTQCAYLLLKVPRWRYRQCQFGSRGSDIDQHCCLRRQ